MRKVWMLLLGMLLFSSPSMAGNKGIMGALLGAGIGAGIGHAVDRSGGSGKGAAIGAIGGYIIGNQMDKSDRSAREAGRREATASPPTASQAQRPVGGDTLVTPSGGNRLVTRNCAQGQGYFNRSLKTRNNDDKVYYLQKAAELCPGDARVHNDLGVAYYTRSGRHDRDRARVEFQEALKIKPDYSVARDNLNSL